MTETAPRRTLSSTAMDDLKAYTDQAVRPVPVGTLIAPPDSTDDA